jgi:peptidoglycan endopeptidase LytE
MIGVLVAKTALSMKKEVVVILAVIIFLLGMPIFAFFSLVDVSGLSDSGATLYTGTGSVTNTYIYGFCTFWVAQRRIEMGAPIPNTWGDAHTWDDRAPHDGYQVDHTPGLYAVMQTDAGDLGHVAFVEEVDPGGGWTVSEMNYKGWDIVSGRTFKPEQAKNFNFIH